MYVTMIQVHIQTLFTHIYQLIRPSASNSTCISIDIMNDKCGRYLGTRMYTAKLERISFPYQSKLEKSVYFSHIQIWLMWKNIHSDDKTQLYFSFPRGKWSPLIFLTNSLQQWFKIQFTSMFFVHSHSSEENKLQHSST